MRPEIVPDFIPQSLGPAWFELLRDGVPWVNRNSPRDECFMAAEGAPQVYSYGNDNNARTERHTYHAVPMHELVLAAMEGLNIKYRADYNVCVLNYYKDRHQHLGWHPDDSPEQDLDHPIAVVAVGATRQIWWKHKSQKGAIPDDQKVDMVPGLLFIMPGGFQAEHVHRIPKHDRECGGRISMTFRKLVR